MQHKIIFLSPQLSVLLKRLGIILLCMQLTRIVFLFFNWSNFNHVGFTDFAASIWFDCITISLIAFPFIVLSLIPFNFCEKKWYLLILKFLFHFFNLVFIALNLVDVVYFSFTQKRSTADLLAIVGGGDDFAQQIGSFFKDFWLLIVILLVFVILASWLNKKIKHEKQSFYLLKKQSPLLFHLHSLLLLPVEDFV